MPVLLLIKGTMRAATRAPPECCEMIYSFRYFCAVFVVVVVVIVVVIIVAAVVFHSFACPFCRS